MKNSSKQQVEVVTTTTEESLAAMDAILASMDREQERLDAKRDAISKVGKIARMNGFEVAREEALRIFNALEEAGDKESASIWLDVLFDLARAAKAA